MPCVVEWPAKIKPRITAYPASTMDIFPTIVDLLGLPQDSMLDVVDGDSLKPLFAAEIGRRGKPIPFCYRDKAALIDNDLKLIAEKVGGGKYLLFDLQADKTESRDISAQRPAETKKMQAALEAITMAIERSQQPADYPEGEVTREGPHGRFWYAIPEYQPYLKDWAARPEYKNWVNRKVGGKKRSEK